MKGIFVLAALLCIGLASALPRLPRCLPCRWSFFPKPVCGTDGKTYFNRCELHHQQCITRDPDLKILYNGSCVDYALSVPLPDVPQPQIRFVPLNCTLWPGDRNAPCPMTKNRRCGVDFKTYANECYMCRTQKRGLMSRHDGGCTKYELWLRGVPSKKGEEVPVPRLPNCRDVFLPCPRAPGNWICARKGKRYRNFPSECELCNQMETPESFTITKLGGIC